MVKKQNSKKRPVIVTIICIISFIGTLQVIPLVISESAQQIGKWYPPYMGLSAIIGLISIIGIWKMKRWAVYLYTTMVVINQITGVVMDLWNIMTILFPGIAILAAFYHLKKMN